MIGFYSSNNDTVFLRERKLVFSVHIPVQGIQFLCYINGVFVALWNAISS
jgi:hypothetical protein